MIRVLALVAPGKPGRDAFRCLLVGALCLSFTTGLSADSAQGQYQYGSELINRTDPDVVSHEQGPVEDLMQSIVAIEVVAVENARTEKTFGSTRSGSGVVIDTAGLIVTTGDLVAEADEITVTFGSGQAVGADLVAYDRRTGLGLVRAAHGAPTVAMPIGASEQVKVDDLAMIIPASGEPDAVAVMVGKIDTYSGGWEYIIEDALHTYPPSTSFSGAALVSTNGKLLGVGALVSIDIDIDPKVRVPGNVFVPIDTLTATLGKLLIAGRSDSPERQAWIGLDVKKTKRGVAVRAVTPDGPAETGGMRAGDILVAVNKKKVDDQTDFFTKIWNSHKPGDRLELLILRGSEYHTVALTASDYYEWLRQPSSETQLTELVE